MGTMLTARLPFGPFAPRSRRVFLCAVVALLSLVSCASASAALNLTGTWSANYHCETGSCAGSDNPATDTLTQAEGSDVVTGSNAGETITGTLTGNTFVFESSVGAYTAKATLTVAANGLSWSGPLEDSNHTTGTYTATREVPSGSLSQLPSPSNCVSVLTTGNPGCGTLIPSGLEPLRDLVVSPDGRNAYATGQSGGVGALIEFSRDPASGALKEIGCVTGEATVCAPNNDTSDAIAMKKPEIVEVSPNGANVYVSTTLENALVTFSRNAETGLLTETGCISHNASTGCAITEAHGLDGPGTIAVSPDEKNVYVTSYFESAVAEFTRDTSTGALSPLPSPHECISSDAASECPTHTAKGLEKASSVAVSPDGANVYVASLGESGGDIAEFEREPSTGALKPLASPNECLSTKVVPECTKVIDLDAPGELIVSSDGKNVYTNSFEPQAVLEFERNTSGPEVGALKQLEAPNTCVSSEATTPSGCIKVKGIEGPFGMAISPDGSDLYATGETSDAIATFTRNPSTGALTQFKEPYECITEAASGCDTDEAVGLKKAFRPVLSPDGTNVYVAGEEDAIAEFSRAVTPTVTGVNPNSGSEAGSTEVTITGSGFAEGASVDFGSTPALSVTVDSASEITATSPAGNGSDLNVTVTNPAGTSAAVAADEFTYTTPTRPTIGEIAPTYGTELGATKVTIIGTEFLPGAEVRFGANPATNVTVDSGKEITATDPAGALGVVNVTVTTPHGTSAETPGDEYKYVYVPPHELGGMNIAGYCERIGDDGNGGGSSAYLKGGVNGPEYAYNNWACVEDDGHAVEIATTGPAPSMENLCTLQYGVASYGYASEPNTAFSWNCYEDLPPAEENKGGGGKSATEPAAKTATLLTPIFSVPPLIVPPPLLVKTGNVAPVSGTVLVKLPGTSKFVPLSSLRQVPFGSIIEATHGTVSVTTAEPGGKTQTGEFFEGEFILRQSANGVVVAELTGGDFAVCPTKRERSHIARAGTVLARAAASGSHVVRKLWANAHGKFSTKGNYAAGAVQGTEWLTEDLCDGTLIKVTRDRVAVTNLVNRKHVEVTTGHHYLAKAP